MADMITIMESGKCMECGAKEIDGLSCFELFGYPLVWEHQAPELYALHFWLVSCYMIQHPSHYTQEGYRLLVQLFTEAYDHGWNNSEIQKRNREVVGQIGKIANPLASKDRNRSLKYWSMTIEDLYLGGEEHAIANLLKWRDRIRSEIK
ncbi:DUF5946 family protein [Cohnella sp. REN36]|uniref:DUF5946 family protein n=1 Tax=Cohnella sp. REN36 TaxID=2887347 RepID=UPI001D159B4D|nr:DUF5946 family protein [Cohnella sp. REN36]MCC3373726.1 DUF5946 family protein [Cohnella sp. REN36]